MLAQQRVLGNEVCPGAGQIGEWSHEEGVACRPRPLPYTLLDATEEGPESALEQIEESGHGSLGFFEQGSEVRDAGKRARMPGLDGDGQRHGKERVRQNGQHGSSMLSL